MVHDDDDPAGRPKIRSTEEPQPMTPPANGAIRDAILKVAREHPNWGRLAIRETLEIEYGLHIDQAVVNYVLREVKTRNPRE